MTYALWLSFLNVLIYNFAKKNLRHNKQQTLCWDYCISVLQFQLKAIKNFLFSSTLNLFLLQNFWSSENTMFLFLHFFPRFSIQSYNTRNYKIKIICANIFNLEGSKPKNIVKEGGKKNLSFTLIFKKPCPLFYQKTLKMVTIPTTKTSNI